MSRILSEEGIRYELSNKGSFVRKGFIMNHVLSYRDTYDQYGLPRDVMKSIVKDINAAKRYARAAKDGFVSDEKTRLDYFKVLREYYTSKNPMNPGERPASRFAPFLGYKNAVKVVKDLMNLRNELDKAENKPEFED